MAFRDEAKAMIPDDMPPEERAELEKMIDDVDEFEDTIDSKRLERLERIVRQFKSFDEALPLIKKEYQQWKPKK